MVTMLVPILLQHKYNSYLKDEWHINYTRRQVAKNPEISVNDIYF